jgi:SPP1 family predicted phage head-tail adaptor
MRAGRLDRMITIQRRTVTESDSGEPVETWTNLFLRRAASVSPVRGDERLSSDQLVASEQVEFRIRYAASVASLGPKDRIVYPALNTAAETPATRNIYDVHGCSEIGRREGLKIIALRRADAIS